MLIRTPRERLLFVGTNPAALALARELDDRRHELGIEIVGFADPHTERIGRRVLGRSVGAVKDIAAMVRDRRANRIVVSLPDARGKLPMTQLLDLRVNTSVRFHHVASAYEEYTGKIAVDTLRPSWLVFSSGFRKTRLLLSAKRAIDVALALVGLVIAAPAIVMAALARPISPGGVRHRKERVGLNGRIFTIHEGPRQLWNVLRGDMSFVGPSPERADRVAALSAEIPYYGQRHVVKPGLTGWAQIHHASAPTAEDAVETLQYDLYYIKNLSLWLDLTILAAAAKAFVLPRGGR